MRIIALTQTKGGSGKSTIAQALSVEAVREGNQVLLVDLDPSEAATKWWRRRGGPANPMIETNVRSLGTLIDAASRKDIDLMILDTPGELMPVIRAAVASADVIVVPMAPSIKDWEALEAVENIIAKADKKSRALFVINRFRSNTDASIQARAALHKRAGAVPHTISLATDHEKADAEGKSGAEINRKIAGEIGVLWEDIKRIGAAHEQASDVSAA